MKAMKILSVLAVSMAAVACGGSSTKQSFPKPTGTIAVNFKVDDRANAVFLDKEMQWKGSMLVDPATRVATLDSTWSGKLPDGSPGFASLYDDGPWDTCTGSGTTLACGHEPLGAVAGDHIFGATVFVAPPAAGAATVNYEYGLIDHKYGDGWLWTGHTGNGKFPVAAGAITDIDAEGHTFAKFGSTDIQMTLNKNNIDTTSTWDTSSVKIKGSAWGWNEITLTNDGTGKFVFTLSTVAGAGKQLSHTGLAATGDKPEFIFVVGGKEYKDANSTALTTGVTAGTKAGTATTFSPATIQIKTDANAGLSKGNTYITIT